MLTFDDLNREGLLALRFHCRQKSSLSSAHGRQVVNWSTLPVMKSLFLSPTQ